MADRPEYYSKDIGLLPNPSYDQVPRGSAKVSPVEEGLFVDALSPEQWSVEKCSKKLQIG